MNIDEGWNEEVKDSMMFINLNFGGAADCDFGSSIVFEESDVSMSTYISLMRQTYTLDTLSALMNMTDKYTWKEINKQRWCSVTGNVIMKGLVGSESDQELGVPRSSVFQDTNH